MSRFLASISVLAVIGQGCNDPNSAVHNPLTEYRLEVSTEERPLVEDAITMANDVLQDSVHLRLRAAWQNSNSSDSVPVYLIGSYNVGTSQKVWIPQGERFVLINQPALIDFLSSLTKRENFSAILAVILLHEIGHLINGDAGSYAGGEILTIAPCKANGDRVGLNSIESRLPTSPVAFIDARLNKDVLNSQSTPSKNRELAADRFAARQLRQAMKTGETIPRFSAGMKVATALTLMNFDVFSRRLLNHFGDQTNSAYLDAGYSHPNFELRLLIVLNEISPTPKSKDLIDDFLAQQGRPRSSGILFDGRTGRPTQRPVFLKPRELFRSLDGANLILAEIVVSGRRRHMRVPDPRALARCHPFAPIRDEELATRGTSEIAADGLTFFASKLPSQTLRFWINKKTFTHYISPGPDPSRYGGVMEDHGAVAGPPVPHPRQSAPCRHAVSVKKSPSLARGVS